MLRILACRRRRARILEIIKLIRIYFFNSRLVPALGRHQKRVFFPPESFFLSEAFSQEKMSGKLIGYLTRKG